MLSFLRPFYYQDNLNKRYTRQLNKFDVIIVFSSFVVSSLAASLHGVTNTTWNSETWFLETERALLSWIFFSKYDVRRIIINNANLSTIPCLEKSSPVLCSQMSSGRKHYAQLSYEAEYLAPKRCRNSELSSLDLQFAPNGNSNFMKSDVFSRSYQELSISPWYLIKCITTILLLVQC